MTAQYPAQSMGYGQQQPTMYQQPMQQQQQQYQPANQHSPAPPPPAPTVPPEHEIVVSVLKRLGELAAVQAPNVVSPFWLREVLD